MDWRHDAACLTEDPELFFPIGNTGPALVQIEEAKAVCRRCPVVDTCLKWAIETGQDAGVWGGMSADERRGPARGGPGGRGAWARGAGPRARRPRRRGAERARAPTSSRAGSASTSSTRRSHTWRDMAA